MKYINIITLFLTLNIYAQFGVNVGIDPKVGIFGTDNQYTEHDGILNIHVKGEYYGRENDLYIAIGAEYANLEQKYLAWFVDFGVPINIEIGRCKNITIVPQFEFGDIFREHIQVNQYDKLQWDDTYYYGINLDVRYKIWDQLAIGIEGSVDRASDLPDRDWRYGSKIILILLL